MNEEYRPVIAIYSLKINGEIARKGYEVSNRGNIRYISKNGTIVKCKWNTTSDKRKRYTFQFKGGSKHTVFAHRLVAQSFLDDYEADCAVRPKDGNYDHISADNLIVVRKRD